MARAAGRFEKLNNVKPGRMILYRDGVGEGQMVGVCQTEIEQI